MFKGILYALIAGLMWGLVFVGPLLVPEYPAALQSVGRYVAFGLIALPLAWLDRKALRQLTRSDWLEAAKLALVGNLLYYLFLASAIQRAGAPVPTMIIGTLPVVIAISANLRNAGRDGRLPWLRLVPSLLLIAAGIACVNQAELGALRHDADADLGRYAWGAWLAFGGVVCWTWYPLRNADWLRAHPGRRPRTWATAQGLVTLPMALLGYALLWLIMGVRHEPFAMPFGPRPAVFIGLMLAIGLFASWLGTLCWNEASQRLPTAIVGQLIVFETLAALSYAFLLRGQAPGALSLLGVASLVCGVLWAVRIKPVPVERKLAEPATVTDQL
ncbi:MULTISPECIES: DMT family transporter [Dyella]|uniref:DMT family transporter n=2 Tax=Dyella TaxID=231454 RepID=A0A4R0YGY6_9GAMM|nr:MULTISPECIES: DMT family transporter [Dyella]TBR37238.1 DMT family transporter [Dyella terrae]TCI07672.1 DMT family transporter [Dyella soli]